MKVVELLPSSAAVGFGHSISFELSATYWRMLLYRYSCRCVERPAVNTAGGKVLEKRWAEITNSVNSEEYDDS